MTSKKYHSLAILVFVLVIALFLIFPLEFLKLRTGPSISFKSVNWTVGLINWYWESGLRYDCETISLLGHQTPVSRTIPTYDGEKISNLISQIGSEHVISISGSDYRTTAQAEYIQLAAKFNEGVLADCGLDRFKRVAP